jgi:hypothetical protein
VSLRYGVDNPVRDARRAARSVRGGRGSLPLLLRQAVRRERETRGMDPGVAGIIGGAVGVVLTGLVRALGIPSEVRRHDATIRDRDDMLATWVADRDYALKRTCKAIRARLPQGAEDVDLAPSVDVDVDPTFRDAIDALEVVSEQMQASRAREADAAIADARGQALHEYRDEARRARLDVATILAAEGWPHAGWRKLRRQPVPALMTPGKATPLLDGWRKPSSMADKHTYPEDATKRTLDDSLGSMPVTGP